MIAGDGWKPEEIKRLLKSLEPHCDGVFVSYNGTKHKNLPWSRWTSLPVKVGKQEWKEDFSYARNHALSLIPRKDFKWWFWIDTDDVLVAPKGLQPIFDSLDAYTQGIFLKYDYAIEPNTGERVVVQWRERIFSTEWQWLWRHPIHEVCTGPMHTQFARRDDVWIEHLRAAGEDRGARTRNRRIIAKAMKDFPEEPRHMYYFANECLAEADSKPPGSEKIRLIDAAVVAYRKFLGMMAHVQTDDVYSAAVRVGDLLTMKGDYNGAVDEYLQAIKFYPDWPDAYVGAAKAMMMLADWGRMRSFADLATKLDRPFTAAAVEPLNEKFNPFLLRGIAREELGDLDGSVKDYKAAQKYWNPPDGQIDDKIKEIRNKKRKLVKKQTDWDLRKERRGTKRDRSICFYTQELPEVWNPKTLEEEGHGGAETMTIEIAKRFAADGWRSVVFGTPGSGRGEMDGVEYWNSDEFLPNEGFKVFVSSRAPQPFGSRIDADVSLLWMHDVNVGPNLDKVSDRPDAIVALTQWHKHHLMRLHDLPEDRFVVIPNGFDPELYPEQTEIQDDYPVFFWGSSPDRGLDSLLSMWPNFKSKWPKAELHCFYGWKFIDYAIEHTMNIYLYDMKQRILGAIESFGAEQGGIYWHDRVPPKQLARLTYDCNTWAYPTQFMETFCLTAIQTQAAGLIPITSELAALKETVPISWLKVEGWPQNSAYQTRFMNKVASVWGDDAGGKGIREQARRIGRLHAMKYTIDKSYDRWNEVIDEISAREPVKQVVMGASS